MKQTEKELTSLHYELLGLERTTANGRTVHKIRNYLHLLGMIKEVRDSERDYDSKKALKRIKDFISLELKNMHK